MLRTISDQISSFAEFRLDVIALNSDLTHGWSNVSCQTLKSSRLAGSIDTEQSKALTKVKTEGCLFHCFNRCTTERVIFLLEIADSDAVIAIDLLSIVLILTCDRLTNLTIIGLSFNASFFSQDIIIHHESW